MKSTRLLHSVLNGLCLAVALLLTNTALCDENTKTTCESVVVAKVHVVCLDQGIGSYSAAERAASLRGRLLTLASNLTFDPTTLSVVEVEGHSNIVAGEVTIVSLSSKDLHVDSDSARIHEAEQVAEASKNAITEERRSKSPEAITWGICYSLIATLVLLLTLRIFKFVYRKVHEVILSGKDRYIPSLRIQSFELLNSSRIVAVLTWLTTASRVFMTLMAFYIYVPTVLSFFPATANFAPKLYGYVVHPLVTIFWVFIDFIPNLFFILAITLITRYALKTVRFIFVEIGNGNLQFQGFYREWADPTYKLVRVLILAFALVMAFPYLPGSSSPAFQGVSVFLGILLSLGSTSAIANIVAGVVLTYMRPFKVGDRVKIADTIGDVVEKTLLVTRIRSIKNVEITIPNAMVLGAHIVNYSSESLTGGLILNTTVTIGYDVPWRQVHELLIAAALRTEEIDSSKKPFILQTALNDFYVSYELNAYTTLANQMASIYSKLHQNIQDSFFESGVEIMSPHYSALRDGSTVAVPPSYLK